MKKTRRTFKDALQNIKGKEKDYFFTSCKNLSVILQEVVTRYNHSQWKNSKKNGKERIQKKEKKEKGCSLKNKRNYKLSSVSEKTDEKTFKLHQILKNRRGKVSMIIDGSLKKVDCDGQYAKRLKVLTGS